MAARLHDLHLDNNNLDWHPDLEQEPFYSRRATSVDHLWRFITALLQPYTLCHFMSSLSEKSLFTKAARIPKARRRPVIERLRCQVGWEMGRGYPIPSRPRGLGSVVNSPSGVWCFLGAPERLSLQYLSQILHFSCKFWCWTITNLDVGLVYQLMLYVRHSFEEIVAHRGLILRIF